MAQEILKVYSDALGAVKRNTCSEEDQRIVTAFYEDARRDQGRWEYFLVLFLERYPADNPEKKEQVFADLWKGLGGVSKFADGIRIPEELLEPTIQFVQYWHDLTKDEQKSQDS